MRCAAAVLATCLLCLAAPPIAANPGADRCADAMALGAVPPDAFEPGIVLPPDDEDWRTFSLTAARRVRVETVGDPLHTDTTLQGYADCPSDPQRVGVAPIGASDDRGAYDLMSAFDTACLPAGTYWIRVSNGGLTTTPAFGLRVRDLGSCAPHDQIVVRVVGLCDLDGDQDGIPDTGETFDVSLEIANTSDVGLADVVARIDTPDPRLVCASPALVSVGSLPPGSRVTIADAVRLRVNPAAERGGPPVVCASRSCSNFHAPNWIWWGSLPGCASDAACRRGTDQDYAGSFEVRVSWSGLATDSVEQVSIELDLDARTPPVPTTTWVEGFEDGFGAFSFQNLDAGRATNDLSDGFRCAYHDPWRATCPWSAGCDEPCYLGFEAGQAPLNSWHRHTTTSPDGGRAFLGSVSVHYGTHSMGDLALDTYPLSQLDALRTTAGIPLAARVCRDDPATSPMACGSAADCVAVGGGPCVAAAPELALAHQISTLDSRSTNTPFGETPDRAVVQARVAGTGPWRTLRPFENVHDALATAAFSNCMFDPVDDESTEDHLDPGWDPSEEPQQGPSSTCFPEFAFSYLGDTDEPFAPERIGRASHGPGLPGSLGLGTWVESRFDLSAFRGQTIDLRLLFTSIKVNDIPTVGALIGENVSWDDGWYVDHVRVTQALGAGTPTAALDLATPPAAGTDTDLDGIDDGCDNCPGSANIDQRDLDRDGAGDVCDADRDGDAVADGLDCRPTDPSLWSAPGPARDLRLDGHAPTRLRWLAPEAPGAATIAYGIVRSASASGGSPGQCLAQGTFLEIAEDVDPAPPAGTVSFYWVVTWTACGSNAGQGSAGTPRPPSPCF